jgi:hypothetical protein
MSAASKLPPPPTGLCPEARAFWINVTADYALEPWQLSLLETAAHAKDQEVRCRKVLDTEGMTISTGAGMVRARPEATILRDARSAFIRATAALKLGDAS